MMSITYYVLHSHYEKNYTIQIIYSLHAIVKNLYFVAYISVLVWNAKPADYATVLSGAAVVIKNCVFVYCFVTCADECHISLYTATWHRNQRAINWDSVVW